MNAEQKQRVVELLSAWRVTAYALHADRMADLLQELVCAPEAEPFAVIHLDGSFVHVEFKQTIAGTGKFEVYAAPPVPSVPDEACTIADHSGKDRTIMTTQKWKLVPVEPTPEMIDALNNDDSDEFRHAYHVMLEAAPQPPKLSDERIKELSDMYMNMYGFDDVAFARAIEREILGGGE